MRHSAGEFPIAYSRAGVLALQRAMVWLGRASGAIVFIEPSPYEIGRFWPHCFSSPPALRLRLVVHAALLALFLLNVGYTTAPFRVLDSVGVRQLDRNLLVHGGAPYLFAMVVSEDTEARLDMLRRGLIVGAMIAATAALAGYFNLVPAATIC